MKPTWKGDDDAPYRSLASVPSSTTKNVVEALGKWLFILELAVFPISYLDDDLVVFDFELFKTREKGYTGRAVSCTDLERDRSKTTLEAGSLRAEDDHEDGSFYDELVTLSTFMH
jgi:hypothetical protein